VSQYDDDIRVRPGRIRHRGGGRQKAFVHQVLRAVKRAGEGGGRRSARPGRSGFGRGRGRFGRSRFLGSRRRVIVKARVVRGQSRSARATPMASHLSYLKRDGVTRDGTRGQMFDAASDQVDDRAFAGRCQDDRHHFRFIVSPEDAGEMTDLRGFTRDLVAQMETDLGTQLDWVAIDHWNTDNPHVHLLVRGVTDDGADLVIARDYISRGLRSRAEDLVAIELGPKPEHAIRSTVEQEVDADRWTRLDAEIQMSADERGLVDLRPQRTSGDDPYIRRLMIGRLQRLERMGLASSSGPAQWALRPDAEAVVRDLSVRGDIIKTMHRALAGHGLERPLADYVIETERAGSGIVGRLVELGLHDELAGEAYAVVDGVGGRVHHVHFRGIDAMEHASPPGGIVEVRRFGAPEDRSPTLILVSRSDIDIAQQVRAPGATWLDHRLVSKDDASFALGGFGAEARAAVAARVDHLIEQGLAQRRGQRVILARNLLATLRRQELDVVGASLAVENGVRYRPAVAGETIAGTYRKRLSLSSGRFAMIDDGLGFSLVPWAPSLERQLGRHVAGIARPDGGIDWSFGRKRSPGL
jgi:type IV secretory pathway VirD2 relaxase